MIYLLLAAILLLALGLALLGAGRRRRVTTGLPAGEVVYDDTGLGEAVREPLVSRRYGLVGRPDYLVRVKQGGREVTIPVEVKSRRKPAQPLESHVLQLGAYCILVEEQSKAAPPYGLIRYADGTFRIPYTGELRRAVLDTAEAIRRARRAPDVRRQHEEPGRCRRCGYRRACGPEALGEPSSGH